MIKKLIIASLVLIIGKTAYTQAKDGKYIVDYKSSTIAWKGEKVTGSGHNGNIRVSSGVVNVAGNSVSSAKLKVDLNSMTCADLTDPEYNSKLINHLKSEDWFNTAKFPDAQLEIISGTVKKDALGNTHELKGKLTIKGITQEITFPAKLVNTDKQITVNGVLVFDRSKFDVRYGSTAFFSDLGDKAISNDVKLTFNIIANI